MDSLGKIMDFIVAAIIMLYVPFVWGNSEIIRLTQEKQYELLNSFVADISDKGCISRTGYEAFLERLSDTDKRIITELEHKHKTTVSTAEGQDDYWEGYYTEDILNCIYSSEYYTMSRGDHITVRIKSDNNIITCSHSVNGISDIG